MRSSGPYGLQDLDDAGGIPTVMKELSRFLHLYAITVSEKMVADNIKDTTIYDKESLGR